jgi:4-amino-4-deoxy-L-arabinose transferase-like glycosyltransferase
MAACFLVLGVGVSGVLTYGIGFHVATSVLLFEWTRRAVGLAPAVAAVVLFSTSGPILETGVSGLAEPAVMFFFTLSLFFFWRAQSDGGVRWHFGAGIALGLATLARTSTALAAPLFVLATLVQLRAKDSRAQRPWRELGKRAGVFLLGMLVLTTPWMARNWSVAGTPGFSLHSYFLLPSGTQPEAEGDKWDVTLPWVSGFVSPVAYARSHPDRVWEKWTRHAGKLLSYYPNLGRIRLLSLVALLGLALTAGRNLRPIAWLLFAAFAVHAAFVCLTDRFIPRYHYQVLPGMLLIGMGVIWNVLGRLPRPGVRLAALLLAVVAMADPGRVMAAAKRVEAGATRVDRGDMEFIEGHTRDDAVIVSDVSWVVTWETRRRSIRAHFDRRADGAPTLSVLRFHDEFLPIDAVYLRFLDRRTRVAHQNLRSTPRFDELFPHRHRFPSGAVFYYR